MWYRDSDGMRNDSPSRSHGWEEREPEATVVLPYKNPADKPDEEKVTKLVALYWKATEWYDKRMAMGEAAFLAAEEYVIAQECGDELAPYVARLVQIWDDGPDHFNRLK